MKKKIKFVKLKKMKIYIFLKINMIKLLELIAKFQKEMDLI